MCIKLYLSIYMIFFIYSSISGRLCRFHILTIVKNAAMNMGMQMTSQVGIFVFFEQIPRSGITGLDFLLF